MPRHLEEWSKEELISALRRMQTAPPEPAQVTVRDPTPPSFELATTDSPRRVEAHDGPEILTEARSRYADLYDLAPVAYLTIDREARILECNLEAASLFGWPRSELIGEPLPSVVTIVELPAFQRHLQRCFETAARVTAELTFSTWRGRVVVEMVAVPVVGPRGRVTTCTTTLNDITAIKTSEERLRVLSEASEALVSSLDYSTTLATVTQLMVPALADLAFIDLRDDDGRIARYAPRLSRTISAAEDTPQSSVLESGQPMLAPACSVDLIRRALAGGLHDHVQHREGSLLLVPLSARDRTLGVLTCVMVGSGRHHTVGDLALAQQVASRAAMAVDNARLYFAARRAIRAREDVAAIVSHDLRNPLQGIRLHCETLLETRDLSSSSTVNHLQAIQRGVLSMERLIRDLLDMARIEAGQLVISRDDHETAALVSEAVSLVRPMAERKQIAVAVSLPSAREEVHCDRERILQVLSNVLGNAIKFTPSHGTITLDVSSDGEATSFSVRDSGPGIPPEHLPHLFERYWRANRSDTKGVGLGLYIAKAIIDAHGGDITVDSEVNAGATVRFTIPRAQRVRRTSDGRASL